MRLFIFDMGNVLLYGVDVIPAMAKELGIDEEELRADYMIYDTPLMDGYLDPSLYYDHLERKFGTGPIVKDLFHDLFSPVPNPPMIEMADRLREKGHRVVIGSNTFAPHSAIVERMDDALMSHFDHYYASHLIHLSKPEPMFFRYIAGEEGFPLSAVSFIDDLQANVDAAASLGIECLHYKGEDKDARAGVFFSKYLQ